MGCRDGIQPPATRNGGLAVIGALKNTPGAVGYVSKPVPELKLIQKY